MTHGDIFMQIKYEDGFCYLSNNGVALTLYGSNLLELQEFDGGGKYGKVEMELPVWLAEAIRQVFQIQRLFGEKVK